MTTFCFWGEIWWRLRRHQISFLQLFWYCHWLRFAPSNGCFRTL